MLEKSFIRRSTAYGVLGLAGLFCCTLSGCERREKVLEVDVPGADIEIHKSEKPDGQKGLEIEVK